MPQGTALYVRRISQKKHGTPKQFAKRCADHKLGWVAIGALWQDVTKSGRPSSRMMNKPEVIDAYAEALEALGIEVWVWGYPWQDREEQFVETMVKSVGGASLGRILLDPELGSNPTRSTRKKDPAGKQRADAHATKLVRLFAEEGSTQQLGLSTYGTGYRIGWFPLTAFTRALAEHFGGRTFIGGQTYTVGESLVDRSIADMVKCIEKVGASLITPQQSASNGVEVVPNFGSYARYESGPKKGKARPKTSTELRAHLYGFINDDEPIDAVIGWAENFMREDTWDVLAEFADLMKRGACRLPPSDR